MLEHLDGVPLVDRKINGPVMMPISEKYKDLGTIVVGKLESGRMKKGDQLLMMPNKVSLHPSNHSIRAILTDPIILTMTYSLESGAR